MKSLKLYGLEEDTGSMETPPMAMGFADAVKILNAELQGESGNFPVGSIATVHYPATGKTLSKANRVAKLAFRDGYLTPEEVEETVDEVENLRDNVLVGEEQYISILKSEGIID